MPRVITGAVASNGNANAPGALVLPATSVHVPGTWATAASGPAKLVELHDWIPEVASTPWKATATAWGYHPLASAPRTGTAPVTSGGVLSTLTDFVRLVASPMYDAEHVTGVPAVSDVTVWGLTQVGSICAPGGETVHVTVTSVRYQALQSLGAGEHAYWRLSVCASASASPNDDGRASSAATRNSITTDQRSAITPAPSRARAAP